MNYCKEQINYYQKKLDKINEKLKFILDKELIELLEQEKNWCEKSIDYYKKQLKLKELLGE